MTFMAIMVLAQFGRGMIQDVSDQLFQKFTDAMRRRVRHHGWLEDGPYHDLVDRYGPEKVGLLTGDTNINSTAVRTRIAESSADGSCSGR